MRQNIGDFRLIGDSARLFKADFAQIRNIVLAVIGTQKVRNRIIDIIITLINLQRADSTRQIIIIYFCQSIIRQATPVFMGCIALFLLCDYIPSATIVLGILALTHLLMGVGQSALTLGMNNISLLHIPSQDASLYLSVNSVFKSFTSAAGSIIAGVILTSLEFLGFKAVKMFDLPFEGTSIGWTFFFILSLALFMLTFPLIKKVDE